MPPATDNGYILAMMDLCIRQSVDMVIPLVDEELAQFKAANPSKVLAPKEEFIKTCLDKWALTHALCWKVEARVPHSILFTGDTEICYPTIIKPRVGRGSRGIVRIANKGELLTALIDKRLRFSEDLVAQEYIEGPEYTVSVVCDHHNTVHAVVPKEIIDKRGFTRLAVTRRNEAIDQLCRDIAEKLNPCGPFNVQLRMRDGTPYIFEINPRFSGTANLTIAAGCDEVGGLIELALGRPYTFGEWREGVVLVRQTHDGIMSEAEFERRKPKGWNA